MSVLLLELTYKIEMLLSHIYVLSKIYENYSDIKNNDTLLPRAIIFRSSSGDSVLFKSRAKPFNQGFS